MMGSEFGLAYGFGIHGLGMVAFWVLIVLLIVFLVRGIFGGNSRPDGKSAVEILDERYAKGEIKKEEYEERRRALT